MEEKLQVEQAFQAFKSAYHIPFAYSGRITPVLSGLSANSNGDGVKLNTVMHLFVEEKVEGRLKRD